MSFERLNGVALAALLALQARHTGCRHRRSGRPCSRSIVVDVARLSRSRGSPLTAGSCPI